MRLDLLVAEKLKISRSLAGNLIKNGKIKLNGKITKEKDFEVKQNEKIEQIKENTIEIFFENENFAIVKKPYGMSVCRTFNTPKYEQVLNEELQKHMTLSGAQKDHEFGLPHRIDKTTEGLILISKTDDFYEKISEKFQNLEIKKKYIAVYDLNFFEKIKKDQIFKTFDMFDCSHGLNCFSFVGRNCICDLSDYKTVQIPYKEEKDGVIIDMKSEKFMKTYIKQHDGFFECIPINGVRHQIRLTMEFLGFSIVGDSLYGSKTEGDIVLFSVFIGF